MIFLISLICYPPTASVLLESGEKRFMYELKVGDKVQSLTHENGAWKVIYTPVFFFGHKNYDEGEYYSLFFNNSARESSESICLSTDHLLFVVDCNDKKIFPKPVSAKNVEIGQCVWKISEDGSIDPVKILRKEIQVLKGQFAPFTEEGTLVVDGIYSSSYAIYHYLAKVIFKPLNGLYYIKPEWMESEILYNIYNVGYHCLLVVERFILTPWVTRWIENFLYYLDYSSYMKEVNMPVNSLLTIRS